MTSGVTEPLPGALRETPHGRPAPQSQAACLEAARHGWPAGPRVGTPEPLTIRELWGSACRPVQRGEDSAPGRAPGSPQAAHLLPPPGPPCLSRGSRQGGGCKHESRRFFM